MSNLIAASAYNNALSVGKNPIIAPSENNKDSSFISEVKKFFENTHNSVTQAEQVGLKSLKKETSLTDLVTAISEAETMLETSITLLKKATDSYKEIERMAV